MRATAFLARRVPGIIAALDAHHCARREAPSQTVGPAPDQTGRGGIPTQIRYPSRSLAELVAALERTVGSTGPA